MNNERLLNLIASIITISQLLISVFIKFDLFPFGDDIHFRNFSFSTRLLLLFFLLGSYLFMISSFLKSNLSNSFLTFIGYFFVALVSPWFAIVNTQFVLLSGDNLLKKDLFDFLMVSGGSLTIIAYVCYSLLKENELLAYGIVVAQIGFFVVSILEVPLIKTLFGVT